MGFVHLKNVLNKFPSSQNISNDCPNSCNRVCAASYLGILPPPPADLSWDSLTEEVGTCLRFCHFSRKNEITPRRTQQCKVNHLFIPQATNFRDLLSSSHGTKRWPRLMCPYLRKVNILLNVKFHQDIISQGMKPKLFCYILINT